MRGNRSPSTARSACTHFRSCSSSGEVDAPVAGRLQFHSRPLGTTETCRETIFLPGNGISLQKNRCVRAVHAAANDCIGCLMLLNRQKEKPQRNLRLFYFIGNCVKASAANERKTIPAVYFGSVSGHCPLFYFIGNCVKASAANERKTIPAVYFGSVNGHCPLFYVCVRCGGGTSSVSPAAIHLPQRGRLKVFADLQERYSD